MPAFMKLGDIKGETTDADSVGPDGGTIVLGTNARETTTASFTSTAGATAAGGHKEWIDLISVNQLVYNASVSPDSGTIVLGTNARDTTAPTTTYPDDGVVDGRDFSVLTSSLRPEFERTGGTERDPFDTGFSGGVVVAAGETRSGGTVADDVIVDGRIITAENWNTAPDDPGTAEEIFRSYLIGVAEPRTVESGGANVLLGDGSVHFGDGSVRFVIDSIEPATDGFGLT
jgi:prepilin-type processing-associated H-X9-DG protein